MNYLATIDFLIEVLFTGIVLMAGDKAQAALQAFLFALICVSLYIIANIILSISYELLNSSKRPAET